MISKVGMDTNISAKITQVVEHGSIYQSLIKGFISVDEILTWLANLPSTQHNDNTFIAYRLACMYKSTKQHYVADADDADDVHAVTTKVHILSKLKNPEYGAIYIQSGGNMDTSIEMNPNSIDEASEDADDDNVIEGSGAKVSNFLLPSLVKFQTDRTFANRIKVICNKEDVTRINADMIPLIIRARATKLFNLLSRVTPSSYNEQFLNTDYIDAIKIVDIPNRFVRIVNRCQYLAEHAPLYWEHVAKDLYKDTVTALINDKNLGDFTRDDTLKFHRLIPGFFPTGFENYTELAYKIMFLDRATQLYVLGFPLHMGSATDQQVSSALSYLSQHGKDKYTLDITQYFKSTEATSIPPCFNITTTIRNALDGSNNPIDVLEENVFSYNPFDRITFVNGNNLFYLIRVEYENMIKTKKNQYTQELLPNWIVLEMSKRMEIAETLGLPPPGTILELLTRLENGKLYESPFPKSAEPANNDNPLLQMMMQVLGAPIDLGNGITVGFIGPDN